MDLVAVEAPMADSLTEDHELLDPNTQVDTDVEVVSVMDSDLLVRPELGKDAVDAPDQSLVSPITMVDPGSRPTGEPTEASRSQDLSEIVVDDLPLDPSSEQEWPSIASSHADHQSDLGVLEDVPPAEEQWPSITTSDSLLEDEWPSIMANEPLHDASTNASAPILEVSSSSDGPMPEDLSPFIDSADSVDQSFGTDVAVDNEEVVWPSIASGQQQESIDSLNRLETQESSCSRQDVRMWMNVKSTRFPSSLPLINPGAEPSNAEDLVFTNLS